jgi:hypothetical protein
LGLVFYFAYGYWNSRLRHEKGSLETAPPAGG